MTEAAPRAADAVSGAADAAGAEAGPHPLMDRIVAAVKTVYDPEIPCDIWELGLIYRVDVSPANEVEIDMTLTAPSCPVAGEIPANVQQAVEAVEEVASCRVELVWEPPWRPDMMSEEARVALDMY